MYVITYNALHSTLLPTLCYYKSVEKERIILTLFSIHPLLLQVGDECKKKQLFQWGFKPLLDKVKASGGCLRFFKGIFSSKLEKILDANTPRRI